MSLYQQKIDVTHPFKEVCTMIAHTFQEAFSAQWLKANLSNPIIQMLSQATMLSFEVGNMSEVHQGKEHNQLVMLIHEGMAAMDISVLGW